MFKRLPVGFGSIFLLVSILFFIGLFDLANLDAKLIRVLSNSNIMNWDVKFSDVIIGLILPIYAIYLGAKVNNSYLKLSSRDKYQLKAIQNINTDIKLLHMDASTLFAIAQYLPEKEEDRKTYELNTLSKFESSYNSLLVSMAKYLIFIDNPDVRSKIKELQKLTQEVHTAYFKHKFMKEPGKEYWNLSEDYSSASNSIIIAIEDEFDKIINK